MSKKKLKIRSELTKCEFGVLLLWETVYIKSLLLLALSCIVAESQRRSKEANALDVPVDQQTSNAWIRCDPSPRVSKRRQSRIPVCSEPAKRQWFPVAVFPPDLLHLAGEELLKVIPGTE